MHNTESEPTIDTFDRTKGNRYYFQQTFRQRKGKMRDLDGSQTTEWQLRSEKPSLIIACRLYQDTRWILGFKTFAIAIPFLNWEAMTEHQSARKRKIRSKKSFAPTLDALCGALQPLFLDIIWPGGIACDEEWRCFSITSRFDNKYAMFTSKKNLFCSALESKNGGGTSLSWEKSFLRTKRFLVGRY